MNKIFAVVTVIFLVISLVSCHDSNVDVPSAVITDERVMPLQIIIDALFQCDGAKYRTAFPPDYDALISEIYEALDCDDFSVYISDKCRMTLDNLKLDYGSAPDVSYSVTDVTDIDPADWAEYFAGYEDINVIGYDTSPERFGKVVRVSGNRIIKGGGKHQTDTATYFFIMQNGTWYLHPMYYFHMFVV